MSAARYLNRNQRRALSKVKAADWQLLREIIDAADREEEVVVGDDLDAVARLERAGLIEREQYPGFGDTWSPTDAGRACVAAAQPLGV